MRSVGVKGMQPDSGLVPALEALESLTTEMSETDIVRVGVEIAQAVTGSRIAYLHFLNDDQNTIELAVWSNSTLAGCEATYARHYPLEQAGIWGDSVRHRRPCIHNDYATTEGRRGLPEGHSALVRHLGVPVEDGGLVRMLMGVGNKPTPYDARDVHLLELVARRIWSVTRQRRALERLLDVERRFQEVQDVGQFCSLEYDCDVDRLTCDHMFRRVFHLAHPTEIPTSLHELLAFVDPADHETVRELLTIPVERPQRVRVRCLRPDGEGFPAELRVELRRREIGRGHVAVGTLQDGSQQASIETLRRLAETDALTGLPNRISLQACFDRVSRRRRASDLVAFHFIDLDGFKPVNDALGHHVGDEVLRAVARRLEEVLRSGDLVARLGGDEFAVVQTGVADPAAAGTMANKIISALSSPFSVCGHSVRVGASVGIALCNQPGQSLRDVSTQADRALYRAKAAGGGCAVIWDGSPLL